MCQIVEEIGCMGVKKELVEKEEKNLLFLSDRRQALRGEGREWRGGGERGRGAG